MAQPGRRHHRLDTYFGSALQLEGEQNIHSPSVGSELHAAPSAPQHFTFSLFPSDTLAYENLPGEGVATERRATEDRRPEASKLLNPHQEDLQDAGGVPSGPGNSPVFPKDVDPFGLVGVAEKADAGGVEPFGIDAYEGGGAPLPVVGAATALAEGTASIEPASGAERAAAANPEALEPGAHGEAEHGQETPPQGEAKGGLETLPREDMDVHEPPPGALSRVTRVCSNGGKTQTRDAATRGRARMGHDAARQPEQGRKRA